MEIRKHSRECKIIAGRKSNCRRVCSEITALKDTRISSVKFNTGNERERVREENINPKRICIRIEFVSVFKMACIQFTWQNKRISVLYSFKRVLNGLSHCFDHSILIFVATFFLLLFLLCYFFLAASSYSTHLEKKTQAEEDLKHFKRRKKRSKTKHTSFSLP